ncbi:histidine phosphatase family protein [Oligoflexus tunisiensis]|uniref:histidine phosphatase family protein n=1 Tax=Oligoflexus tunisiensis TaxID=708132 RepID=UPI00114CCFF5|nr:histidine phosphatase family protein [Oligoflexus tunisiensis]
MKKLKKRLVALRHTPVAVRPGLCYGQIDVPLAASYLDDLRGVQETLPGVPYDRIISSPLQRCFQLATDLKLGDVHKDARLLELSFGHWEGQFWADIPRVISEYWTEDVVHRAPPAGESFLQIIERVQTFLADPELWAAGDHLLLVTHAGVIRALQHLLTGADYASCLSLPIRFGEHRVWEL